MPPVKEDENIKNNFLLQSQNEYYDCNFEEEQEEYFPAKSMFIEREWISPVGVADSMKKEEERAEKEEGESPYFEEAKTLNESEAVRFISPIQQTTITSTTTGKSNESSPKFNRSILNELLPTQVQMENGEGSEGLKESPYLLNDKMYGIIFKACLMIWALTSFYIINTRDANFYSGSKFAEITGWFTCLLVLGVGITAVWARLLAEQTESVVYGLVLAVPTGFGFLGLYALTHWYLLTGLAFFSISAILGFVIYLNRADLKLTTEIVHVAAIFIQSTPKIYGLVLKIVTIYVVFLLIWLAAFTRLFSNSTGLFNLTQFAFIFMLIWFGAVLGTAQKFIIATWMRSWMNQTDDSVLPSEDENGKNVILNNETFGMICLAAGLLTIAKMIRFLGQTGHFITKSLSKFVPGSGMISDLFHWLFTLISTAERLMSRFTDFSIYYSAVCGTDGFINSCKNLSRSVDGHLKLAVSTDIVSQLLLKFSTILITSISTFIIFTVAKSHLTWTGGLIIGLLAASVTDFVASTYISAIDSAFLCYVMDLKRPIREGPVDARIQNAFGPKLSTV